MRETFKLKAKMADWNAWGNENEARADRVFRRSYGYPAKEINEIIARCKAWVGKDDSVLKFELEGRRPLGWYIASRWISRMKYVEGSLVRCDGVEDARRRK